MYILFTNQIYFYVINLLVYFTKKNKNQDTNVSTNGKKNVLPLKQ